MNKERIKSATESLLLVANKELSVKKLADILAVNEEEIKETIISIKEGLNKPDSGIHLAVNGDKIQLLSNPDNGELLKKFLNEEEKGELTKPSLETLTIIAYRQPIAKSEIEQIRGINCGLILRNLMIRGLVEAHEDPQNLNIYYSVTMDFLKFLGISEVRELPDYEKLNSNENLQKLLFEKPDDEQININI